MKYLRKIGKILGISLTGVLLVLVILLYLLNSGTLNGFLASTISSKGSETVNGDVDIEKIEGSIFSNFSIKNIEVRQNDSLLLSLERLHIRYSPSHLFNKELKMELIHLNDLKVNISQNKDSVWNFQNLLPAADKEQSTDTSKSFAWKINVHKFEIDSLTANIDPLDTAAIPSYLRLGIISEFQINKDSVSANLRQFYAKSRSPEMKMETMTGLFTRKEDRITWNNFRLRFGKTYIESRGILRPDSLMASQLNLNISPLDFSEFKPWIPDFELHGDPHVQLELKNKLKKSNVSLSVKEGIQKINLEGWFNKRDSQSHFDLNLAVDSIDGSYWTGNPELKSLINGNIRIKGSGTDFKENNINAKGKFGDVQYGDYELNDLIFNIEKARADINGDLQANTWFGGVSSNFRLKNIFNNIQYDVEALFKEVDLSKLTNNKKLYSDLNVKLKTKGKGIKIDSMNSETELNIYQSGFMGYPVNSMDANIKYNKQNYEFTGLQLNTPFVAFSAEGKGNLEKSNQIDFSLTAKDIDPLMKAINQPDISFSGVIDGNIQGPKDSLDINLQYDLAKLLYDSISAEYLKGHGSLLFGDSLLFAQTNLNAETLMVDSNAIEKLHIEALYNSNQIDSRIDLKMHDSLSLLMDSRIAITNDIALYLNELELNAWKDRWKSGSDSTYILMKEDSIRIHHLNFRSGAQRLNFHGNFAFKGNEDMEMKLENIDLAVLQNITSEKSNIKGQLNGKISLKGTAEKPQINGNLNIDQAVMDSLKLRNVYTRFGYISDSLFFEGNMNTSKGASVKFDAMLPFHFSLVDTFSLPDKNTPVHANLLLGELNLETLNPYLLSSGIHLNGNASADINISNRLGEPHFNGNIGLKNGRFKSEDLGLHYKNITLNSSFSQQELLLNELRLNSEDGYLRANGSVELRFPQPEKGNKVQFNIRGNNFQAVKSKSYNATINPDITLEGTLAEPVFKGKVKVVHSMINADAMLSQFSVRSDNPNPPLLTEATKNYETVKQEPQDTLSEETQNTERFNLYENLRGTFDLTLPGNTWVRGKDMNFELQGDLKAIKRAALIDLFGTLNIKRGYLKYYGKKFEFERGSLTFTGGKNIDPKVDFEIGYDFRDSNRELHTISIQITGRSKRPNFVFYLDGSQIEEQEALSYIVFGKSTNQLTERERGSVDQSAADLAASMAIGQVSNLVQGTLQSTLGLDVVEIGGGKNWKSGSVKIGKYITDDLYLSYQQTFDFDKKEKTIEPEKVSLEYQIVRSWFLQATNQSSNSGFDVIFKRTWK